MKMLNFRENFGSTGGIILCSSKNAERPYIYIVKTVKRYLGKGKYIIPLWDFRPSSGSPAAYALYTIANEDVPDWIVKAKGNFEKACLCQLPG